MIAGSISRSAGGLFESVRHLALSLRARGREVEAFGPHDAHSAEDARAWDPIPLRLHRVLGPRAFGYAPALGEDLRAGRLDLLHSHGLWMYLSAAAARWSRGGGARVVSPRGMLDPWALSSGRLRKAIAWRAYERRHLDGAALVHALTREEAAAIRARGVTAPICVVPNGVEIAVDQPVGDPPWSSGTGERVLLFLGRLHPKKGLRELLAAWHAERATLARGGWRLAIAGWDQLGHRAELERLSAELGLSGAVSFLGPLHGAAKRAAFASAATFILPSHSEGLPMAVLEAWAQRLPVVITPGCHLPEGAAAGAALEVPATIAALAGALRELAAMPPERLREMGVRGRRLVEDRFSWRRIAERMDAAYAWILGGGSPPADVELR